MAKDVGLQAPADAGTPAGVVAGSGVKVKVHSTLGSGAGRLDLPVQAQRQPQPGRRRELRELQLPAAVGRVQDDLQAPGRPEPREHDGHARRTTWTTSRTAGSRTGSASRPATPPRWTSSTAPRRRSAPAYCGRSEDTFDDAEGAFIANSVGPGAGDPLLHRRQQRPAHPARAHLLRAARGRPHVPARARGPGAVGLLRLLRGRHRDDVREQRQHRRRDDRRHARHPRRRPAHVGDGRRAAGRRCRWCTRWSRTSRTSPSTSLLPRRQHAGRRRRDAVHGRRAAYRRERAVGSTRNLPNTDPRTAPFNSLRLDPHDLLRAARQGRTAPARAAQAASPFSFTVSSFP